MPPEKSPLFDPAAARGPKAGPDVGEDTPPPAPLSVAALIATVKNALSTALPQRLCVVGEISNLKLHGSGHVYFRLKDADASIDAVMFKGRASRLKFAPADGLEVVVTGRVDVYDVRGQLQLYVEGMTPRGAGALELAFRQQREKLQREGLFDARHKKPIPRFPRAIGIITSPTGAAVRDIRRTLLRRWPAAMVYVVPSLVQGAEAAGQLAEAVRLLDACAGRYAIDTIIVARGGGSIEDLWAFNEESLARAMFAAGTPIISGVGHESDITIADLVADVRAATPTAAAELAVPDAREVWRDVRGLQDRLDRIMEQRLRLASTALTSILRSGIFRDPQSRLRVHTQHVDELSHRLGAEVRGVLAAGFRRMEQPSMQLAAAHPSHQLAMASQRLQAARRHLDSLSYRNVLRRGYSLTRDASGRLLRSASEAGEGDSIKTVFVDGEIRSVVTAAKSKAPGKRPPKPGNTGDGMTLFPAEPT